MLSCAFVGLPHHLLRAHRPQSGKILDPFLITTVVSIISSDFDMLVWFFALEENDKCGYQTTLHSPSNTYVNILWRFQFSIVLLSLEVTVSPRETFCFGCPLLVLM
jgi:hypothetical protein